MNEFNDKDQSTPGEAGNPPAETSSPGAEHTGSAAPTTPHKPPADAGRQSPSEQPPSTPGNWTNSGQRSSLGQSQSPYGQGQQTPYSPYNNAYPPNQNTPYGQNQNPGQNYNRGYQQGPAYPPYQQYNANTGWQQQQQNRPQDKYEWKFEDYDKLDNNGKKEKKKRSRGLVVFTVSLLCVLSVGIVGLAGFSIYTATNDDAVDGQGESAAVDGETGVASGTEELQITSKPEISESLPVGGKMTIPQVAKAVSPSVVGVIKYDNNQYYEMSGVGSGIVMTADGYIITNAHVVAEGTGFKVELANGDPYDAELIGLDPVTDLAVLKIDAPDLVPAQFGDSSEIEVGETVVAIGNPAGLELAGSVTQGIVSAVNREVRTTNYSMTFIQTDAAINPGNSGGALANEYGQVIGINSSKIVAAGYEGIGFAIPITHAKPIIDDIITNGKVTGRVMLGITCRAVDEVDARNYGIQMGLAIDTIDAASDLSSGGVLKGDILTHIDGERVYDLSDVRIILDGHKPGDSVSLTLYRRIGTKELTYDVTTRLMESS